MTSITIGVHVHPGSRQANVGGTYDGALVVHVRARAVGGAATKESLELVAAAFNVRGADVRLTRGSTSRRKTLSIVGEVEELTRRLGLLLARETK